MKNQILLFSRKQLRDQLFYLDLEALIIRRTLPMRSLYTTSLRTQPQQNFNLIDQNDSCISNPISQSYKDLLFNHLLDIHSLQDRNKENIKLPPKQTKRQSKYSQIAQKLILSKIPQNLGSLNQFVYERQENRVIYTSKKKRQQYAAQENAFKKKVYQKNAQEAILKSDEVSAYEKKIASKVLVERIFNQVYNTPLEEFVQKNTIKRPKHSQLLSLSTLENILSSDCLLTNSQNSKTFQSQQSDYTIQKDKKSTKGDRTVRIRFDPETKIKQINSLKSNYYNLKKVQIPQENSDFKLLIDAQNKLDDYLKQIAQSTQFEKRNSTLVNSAKRSLREANILPTPQPVNVQQKMMEVSKQFRLSRRKSVIFAETIAKVTDDEVVFRRMHFTDLEMGLYMINYVQLERISVIRLQKITIDQSILFLFLDVMCKFAPQIRPLKEISICSIIIDNTTRFAQKISQLLKEINVRRLNLNSLDISSKEFTKICIGMSENECLEDVEMKNNRIDYLAVKSLESLLKINENIKTIDLSGNEVANLPNLKDKDTRIIV